jgi:hypothetical protein
MIAVIFHFHRNFLLSSGRTFHQTVYGETSVACTSKVWCSTLQRDYNFPRQMDVTVDENVDGSLVMPPFVARLSGPCVSGECSNYEFVLLAKGLSHFWVTAYCRRVNINSYVCGVAKA